MKEPTKAQIDALNAIVKRLHVCPAFFCESGAFFMDDELAWTEVVTLARAVIQIADAELAKEPT